MDGKHAKKVLNLISSKDIKVVEIKNKSRVNYLKDNYSNIDTGEAEVLALAEEQEGVAITDDLQCLSDLKKDSKVPVYLSAYLFAGLVVRKLSSKEEVLKAINNLSKKRDWKHSALYLHSKKYIEKIKLRKNKD